LSTKVPVLPDFGSHDVIGHVTIRPAVGGFMFVPHRFPRYYASNILGSWRHRSLDHL